jgi:hypothetical protein
MSLAAFTSVTSEVSALSGLRSRVVCHSRLRGNDEPSKPGVVDAPDPVTMMIREQWNFRDHKDEKVL